MKQEVKHIYLTKEQYLQLYPKTSNHRIKTMLRQKEYHKEDDLIELNEVMDRSIFNKVVDMFPEAPVEVHTLEFMDDSPFDSFITIKKV